MSGPFEKWGELLTVKRFASGLRVAGRFQTGASSTFTITANVQPLAARDMAFLPESGRDVRAAVKIYSKEPLNVGSDVTSTRGDVITYQGEAYEVKQSSGRKQLLGLAHYESIAYLVEGPAP